MARHGGVFGEHRAAQLTVQRFAAARQAARAGQQRSGALCGCAGLAQRRPSLGARRAVAAARDEHHHHMVPDPQVGHAFAKFVDDAGRLMAERHRHWARPVASDHRQVGVAQARCGDLDQHFAAARRGQLDADDGKRL